MADIITPYLPPYANDGAATPAPIELCWVDNGDSYAPKVSLVFDSGTPTGPEIITNHRPPYPTDGEPINLRWVDMGDYYAPFVILEIV